MGAVFTIIVAGCMMLTGDAALRHGFSFTDPAQMAADFSKIFGPWFRTGILLLMINAAALGCNIKMRESTHGQGSAEVAFRLTDGGTSSHERRRMWQIH